MPKRSKISDGDDSLAVAYLRISKADTDADGAEKPSLSIRAQRDAVEAWAKRTGRTLVAVCVEEDGTSGDTPIERCPELLRALQAVGEHGARWMVAARRDRLAREMGKAVDLRKRLARIGARVVTADNIGSEAEGPDSFLLWGMLDLIAEYELRLIRWRTRRALEAKKVRGERVGNLPYGFRVGRDGVHLEEDPDEQAVIATIRSLRHDDEGRQRSAARIARVLTRRGVARRGGKRIWTSEHVARVLAAETAARG